MKRNKGNELTSNQREGEAVGININVNADYL
jgi:hypothetical protein